MDLEREPALIDVVRDWLFEQGISSEVGFNAPDGSLAEVYGFGWAIIFEHNNMTFTSRLENHIIKASAADPTILDTIKAKILYVESKTIDYIIEHVDDDGWEDWTRKTRQPPPLGPQDHGL
jgi:hypothetical protein